MRNLFVVIQPNPFTVYTLKKVYCVILRKEVQLIRYNKRDRRESTYLLYTLVNIKHFLL